MSGVARARVRNISIEIVDALRADAGKRGRSLEEHQLAVLDEHTARTHMRAIFARLDAVLGDEPVLTVDPADAIREDRAERDARDARDARDTGRAEDYAWAPPASGRSAG